MVDVCSDVNVENDVNRSGCVVVDMCNDVCNVNIEIDVNRSGGVAADVCNDVNIKMM